ncbi:MAG: SpoIIE family protein phosphatase, partial [Deltaproteobacteria bacterium]|nr:SpoIIE family protein phosphatase [Deltaproteobacteria bacterium]
RREGREPPLLKRMSELISLLDLTTTLSSSLSGQEILDAALLIVMGELGVSSGALFVRGDDGAYERRAGRGLPSEAPEVVRLGALTDPAVVYKSSGRYPEVFAVSGLELLCPVFKAERAVAVLGIGSRPDGRALVARDAVFLRSMASCAATPIENGLIYHELERVNQRLSVKVFQLNSLFDLNRELASSFDEETIKNLVVTTLMGHLMVSRCALYLSVPGGIARSHERGVRGGGEPALIPEAQARPVLDALTAPRAVSELPSGALRDRLVGGRLALVVPLHLGGQVQGFIATGERVSGVPFTEEDHDFILTLGRQTLAALENVRLHRVQVEKQRQDKELQIAREIQGSLFPDGCPRVPGFEVAAESHACYQVGGDHYDFIPLGGGRLALAIADVSGKSTPASILMASIHASLRALAGSATPTALMRRLNELLLGSTQANKYVTMVYAELDPESRRLTYVNAGHVPPYLLRSGGRLERLTEGGTALGLLEDSSFDVGEVQLEPGDLLTMVTDGVTEAASPEDDEFGDERTVAALRAAADSTPGDAVRSLVSAVRDWTDVAGASDDLTVLILKAS